MQTDPPNGRLFGAFLLGTAILTTVALTHHPSFGNHQPADVAKALAAGSAPNEAFHAFMIVMLGVLYLGLVGYSRRRGLESPLVLAGLIAATVGLAAETGAALIDGFFVSIFGAHIARGNPALVDQGMQVISAAAIVLQILAKFGLVAISAAMVLWSVQLFDRDRAHIALGIVGCVAGTLTIVLTSTVATTLDPHNVALVYGTQALWYAAAGVLMIQRRL
jgi:hypothetical protein